MENSKAPLDLAAIRARAEAATPAPWRIPRKLSQLAPDWTIAAGVKVVAYVDQKRDNSEADFTFIAAARTDIPALLAEVERLNVELATAKRTGAIEELRRFASKWENDLWKASASYVSELRARADELEGK